MKAQIITIGDELLIGQVLDTNAAWMAKELNRLGIEVIKKTTISDEKAAILKTVSLSLAEADIVLVTGGLGPTKDDITKNTLAEYFDSDLIFHQASYDNLKDLFKKYKRLNVEDYRDQCFMPTKADILINKVGTAPGMWFKHDNKVLVSMPGVPYEMKFLMENHVLPKLTKEFSFPAIVHETLITFGIGETSLSTKIADFENQLPNSIKLAYLPYLGGVRLRLSALGKQKHLIEKEVMILSAILEKELGDHFVGRNKNDLQKVVIEKLIENKMSLGTAESCTGGFIAHKITENAGSSAYFNGSIVAYSNDVKMNILKVPQETLSAKGAVSIETVDAMVRGAINALNVDVAIATSGIAGPGGGTIHKEVGTICIGVGNKDKVVSQQFRLSKKRIQNIEWTRNIALNMLRKFLLEL